MGSADCYQKALDLLARRPHFRRQLEEKLRARQFTDDAIEETLGRLVSTGLLDDERVAADFVETRLRKGPVGRRRMRYELEKRGASATAVELALEAAYTGESDLEGARTAAERWLARRPGGSMTALARYLDRQGFASGSVLSVVEELRARPRPEEGP